MRESEVKGMSDKDEKIQNVFDSLCKFVIETLDEKNTAAGKLAIIPTAVDKIIALRPLIK